MDNKEAKMRECLLKHKKISEHLPFSKFTLDDYKDFFYKLDNSDTKLRTFLLLEGWYPEQVDLITGFTEKFNNYFLENDEDEEFKSNLNNVLENEKKIFKILTVFSNDNLRGEEALSYRTTILFKFYKFYVNLVKDESMLILVSFFNQIFSMIQEFVGMTIQFFLPIPDSDKDILIVRKYLTEELAYTFQYCDYFISDYLALFDKNFNCVLNNPSVLINREIAFNRLYEIITGEKIDYSSEEYEVDYNLELKNKKKVEVTEELFLEILRSMPEIYLPLRLCYIYLTGEFYKEEKEDNKLSEIFC